MALEGRFIRLNIHKGWFDDPEKLANRLALLLVGQQAMPRAGLDEKGQPQIELCGFKPYFTGAHWQLDSGNDWFLSENDGVWSLSTRYWNRDKLQALDMVLTKLLYGREE